MDLARVGDASHCDDLKSELSFALGHSPWINLGNNQSRNVILLEGVGRALVQV